MGYIQQFLEHTKNFESPGSFWKWSAISQISAVLRDNCFTHYVNSKLYPNLYVMLVAGTGVRKDAPVAEAENLVLKVQNNKVISGRTSVEAILDELGKTETNRVTNKLIRGGSAIFVARELSAGIISSEEAINVLTDIYDYRANPYAHRLRTGPSFDITKLIFSMFTATNIEMSRAFLTTKAIRGGLLARTLIITPNEYRPGYVGLKTAEERTAQITQEAESWQCCFKKLKEISELKGEFIFGRSEIEFYSDWYIKEWHPKLPKINDATGICKRIHTTIIKVAMCLAANDLSLSIKKHHIEEAMFSCLGLLPNYQTFHMANGKNKLTEAGAIVLQELMDAKNHQMTRSKMMAKHWQDFSLEELDSVVKGFCEAKYIKLTAYNETITLELTDFAIQDLNLDKEPSAET